MLKCALALDMMKITRKAGTEREIKGRRSGLLHFACSHHGCWLTTDTTKFGVLKILRHGADC